MTTQQKINWGLAIGAVIALFYLTKNKNPKIDSSALNTDLLLSQGSQGAEVLELQKLLKEKDSSIDLGSSGENHDGIDGYFGTLTLNALKKITGLTSIKLNQASNQQ